MSQIPAIVEPNGDRRLCCRLPLLPVELLKLHYSGMCGHACRNAYYSSIDSLRTRIACRGDRIAASYIPTVPTGFQHDTALQLDPVEWVVSPESLPNMITGPPQNGGHQRLRKNTVKPPFRLLRRYSILQRSFIPIPTITGVRTQH